MQHTTRQKPSIHGKKNFKHLAAAFAGAIMMSSVMLPGIPTATVHAAANPHVGGSQRSSKTHKLDDDWKLPSLSGTSQGKVNVGRVGKSMKPAARKPTNAPQIKTNEKQAGTSKSKASEDKPNNQAKTNRDAQQSPVAEAKTPSDSKSLSGNTTPTDYKQVVEATATAYAPGSKDNDQWGNKTYTGTNIRPGVIAVDPSVIPLGSRVYLQYPDGHGTYAIAEDTGGAIKGNRIDVAKSTEDEDSNFGIQKVKVYVVKSPNT